MQTNLKSQSDENVIMLNKPRTISERLAEAARSTFVGRKAERRLISDAIAADELPFMVAFIHGPGGIGKSRLIQAVLSDSGPEVRCYMMDCREIEPTPRGFQAALSAKLGLPEPEADFFAVVDVLNQSGRRTVLALDTYESFGLMDTWLRQKFLPSLSDKVFTIIAGREAPNPAWLTTPGWQELFRDIKLGELSAVDAQEMLESRGLKRAQADRIKSFARGYPMVLEIAAAAIRGQPDLKIAEGPPPKVLQQLTNVFLSGMPQESMEAVEAASTVRRVTEPLLRRLLAVSDVRITFNNLQTLPFANFANEGLIFHDTIRETVSKNLARRDPERYRIYRKRAFSYFTHESHRTVARNLWQYTADLLYMIENPIARNAFFPEGASDYRVEPATADDADDIRQIIMAIEPGESAHLFGRWLARHPETFSVAKNSTGRLEAFYFTFEPEKVDRSLLEQDPLMASWLQHLKETPLAPGERVLFLPRWLDRQTGEAPSPSVGACFLDIKRTYMELRPGLRRIYALVTDLAKMGPIAFPLGFGVLEKAQTTVGGVTYYTIINDFGPSSIDGWLAKLIGTELEAKSGDLQETAQIRKTPSEDGRRLLNILFTDIVASTEKAVALGDARWRELLNQHHDIVRRELARFQGREIDTAGDGFLATFNKPANAIRCATSVRDAVRKLGIQIRAGLHLGECEVTADAVRGVAVHIGARVAARAKTGEVLVSGTVKDAMAGSGIQFRNRGAQRLKGIPGEWPLFAIEHFPVDFQESSR